MFAYIGPETILPATSVLAGIGGFLLMFGKAALRPFFAIFGKKQAEQPQTPVPEECPLAQR